jgi:hypothetical protein
MRTPWLVETFRTHQTRELVMKEVADFGGALASPQLFAQSG